MAKGQMHSNKEPRKPKADKKKDVKVAAGPETPTEVFTKSDAFAKTTAKVAAHGEPRHHGHHA